MRIAEKEAFSKTFSKTLSRHPLRFFGYGCLQAWSFIVVLCVNQFSLPDGHQFDETMIRMLFSGSLTIALAVEMLVIDRIDLFGKDRLSSAIAALLVSAGSLLYVLGSSAFFSLWLLVLGIGLTGLGNAFLYLAWGKAFSGMNHGTMSIHILSSFLFAMVLGAIVLQLPAESRIVMATFLPFASCILLGYADLDRNAVSARSPIEKPFAIKAATAFLAFSITFGAMRMMPAMSTSLDGTMSREMVLCVAIAASTTLLISMGLKGPLATRIYRVSMFLFALGGTSALLHPMESSSISFSLEKCGYNLFEGLVWLIYPKLCITTKRHGGLTIFGWPLVILHFGALLGLGLGWILGKTVNSNDSIDYASFLLTAEVLAVAFFVLREKDIEHMVNREEALSSKREVSLAELCAAFAKNYSLTQREQEVLLLLAKGRTLPYIANELCLSLSTVKTHVRHIYTKMEIRDRQDLLDRFDL